MWVLHFLLCNLMKSVNNVVVTAQKHKLLGGKNMSMKRFLVVAFAMLVGIIDRKSVV